jgi:hypothetical protein
MFTPVNLIITLILDDFKKIALAQNGILRKLQMPEKKCMIACNLEGRFQNLE